jgi:two-component sensor histidine kinase
MSGDIFQQELYLPRHGLLENPGRTAASYEVELKTHRNLEVRLRELLAKSEALLRQKNDAMEYQALLQRESDHRLLNDMQMVVSLLSMQGRASSNEETAAQLVKAASRVSMIACIHRRLHSVAGVQTVPFKEFLAAFCQEFSAMLSSKGAHEGVAISDGPDVELPAATAVPLAFIVSELLTNAVKYGDGLIAIRLEPGPGKSHILSVANGGPPLPESFDPAASKGLGMKIVQTFLRKIDGQLQFGRNEGDQGACFTVLFH